MGDVNGYITKNELTLILDDNYNKFIEYDRKKEFDITKDGHRKTFLQSSTGFLEKKDLKKNKAIWLVEISGKVS